MIFEIKSLISYDVHAHPKLIALSPGKTANINSMDRAVFWIMAVATAIMLIVFSYPLFSGMIYTFDDLQDLHLPTRSFYAKALSEGSDFTWCPDLFCGFDLHAEGQVGMYHPLHLLVYRFLPLNLAFNLNCSSLIRSCF